MGVLLWMFSLHLWRKHPVGWKHCRHNLWYSFTQTKAVETAVHRDCSQSWFSQSFMKIDTISTLNSWVQFFFERETRNPRIKLCIGKHPLRWSVLEQMNSHLDKKWIPASLRVPRADPDLWHWTQIENCMKSISDKASAWSDASPLEASEKGPQRDVRKDAKATTKKQNDTAKPAGCHS